MGGISQNVEVTQETMTKNVDEDSSETKKEQGEPTAEKRAMNQCKSTLNHGQRTDRPVTAGAMAMPRKKRLGLCLRLSCFLTFCKDGTCLQTQGLIAMRRT